MVVVRHGIADPGLFHILDTSLEIAHHTGRQLFLRNKLTCTEDADLRDLEIGSSRHHADMGSFPHRSVKDTHENNDAAVTVIYGIKNQCLEGLIQRSGRCRELMDD